MCDCCVVRALGPGILHWTQNGFLCIVHTTSTPQLPFKRPQIQIPSNRDHKALNGATLAGLGRYSFIRPALFYIPRRMGLTLGSHPRSLGTSPIANCPRLLLYPKAQNSPKAPHKIFFGPKNLRALEFGFTTLASCVQGPGPEPCSHELQSQRSILRSVVP